METTESIKYLKSHVGVLESRLEKIQELCNAIIYESEVGYRSSGEIKLAKMIKQASEGKPLWVP